MDKEISSTLAYTIICALIGALAAAIVLFVYGFANWTLFVRVIVVVALILIGGLIGLLLGDAADNRKKMD